MGVASGEGSLEQLFRRSAQNDCGWRRALEAIGLAGKAKPLNAHNLFLAIGNIWLLEARRTSLPTSCDSWRTYRASASS